MESGMHSSSYPNCHHQITYAKFNLKIHYIPPYEHEIWHYEKANVDHIKGSIHEFSWERCFANTSVNDKVNIFNKLLKIQYLITFLTKQLLAMTEIHLG